MKRNDLFVWLGIVLSALSLVGCKSAYEVQNYTPAPEQLNPQEAVYIITPVDGPDEPGCGRLAGTVLKASFGRQCQRIETGDATVPLSAHLTNAAAAGFVYLVDTTIYLWEEESTEWSHLTDKFDIALRLLRVPSGEVVSATRVWGKTGSIVLGRDRVEHLMAPFADAWVDALYTGSDFKPNSYKPAAK